ncbi:hypothetical protein HK102_010891, partial [Quaeritorhiza haematococci]
SGQSITITLGQDLFDEVAKLISPIAIANALSTPIGDQLVNQKVALLGDVEVVTAKNIKITKAEIGDVKMLLQEGSLAVEIKGIHIVATSDVRALKASLGKVELTLTMDLKSRIFLKKSADGFLETDVEDVGLTVTHFDTEIPVTIVGNVLESVTDLFQGTIKGAISSAVVKPIDDALTSGLNSVLRRSLDFGGEVSGVRYLFKLNINDDPKVTTQGASVIVSIDTHVNPPPELMPPAEPAPPAEKTTPPPVPSKS